MSPSRRPTGNCRITWRKSSASPTDHQTGQLPGSKTRELAPSAHICGQCLTVPKQEWQSCFPTIRFKLFPQLFILNHRANCQIQRWSKLPTKQLYVHDKIQLDSNTVLTASRGLQKMTLILALGNSDQIIQISDRRLVANKVPVDEKSNKAGVLMCNPATLVYGFTGLARVGNFDTARWLVKVLFECCPPDFRFHNIMRRLLARFDADFAKDRDIASARLEID